MSRPQSPRQPSSPQYEDAPMHQEHLPQTFPTEQMFHAVSNMLVQLSHTNQTMLNYMSSHTPNPARPDSKIRPKPFAGLPTEDVLSWLDHFDNVASYHNWLDDRKAMEARTVFEGVAATWFIQQPEEVKFNWGMLKALLIQNFAHQNITQTALHQLTSLKQQQFEPVAQFTVKLNQLLLRADPAMSEEMKLFFLWPRLRHDISRRVRDQGPTTFHAAVQIAQRIEGISQTDTTPMVVSQPPVQRLVGDSTPTPMDIDIQNVQLQSRRALPVRDQQGRPKCFYCNTYGHIKRHCRRFQATQQHQNAQIQMADAASLASLPENI